MSQWRVRRKMRKFTMAVKAEWDIEKYMRPNGGTGKRGGKLPMAVKVDEVVHNASHVKETLWTNLGRTDSSALAGNWPRRDIPMALYCTLSRHHRETCPWLCTSLCQDITDIPMALYFTLSRHHRHPHGFVLHSVKTSQTSP